MFRSNPSNKNMNQTSSNNSSNYNKRFRRSKASEQQVHQQQQVAGESAKMMGESKQQAGSQHQNSSRNKQQQNQFKCQQNQATSGQQTFHHRKSANASQQIPNTHKASYAPRTHSNCHNHHNGRDRDQRSLSISSSSASSTASSPSSSSLHIFNQRQQHRPFQQQQHGRPLSNGGDRLEQPTLVDCKPRAQLCHSVSYPLDANYPGYPLTSPPQHHQPPATTEQLIATGFWFPPTPTESFDCQPAPTFIPEPPPPRPWIACGRPNEANHQFSVLSYNVLCDRMVNNEIFPSSPEIALNWHYRRELILKQLLEFDSDIIALQELELEQYQDYFKLKLFNLGLYESIFEPKSRAKTMLNDDKKKRVDGCAIFYKMKKFELIEKHLLEYNQIAMANSRGSQAMLNRVMTKDNIGLAVVLKLLHRPQVAPTDHFLLVSNTHIHWDPECCDVKLIQTIMLMNELQCIAKNFNAHQRREEQFERQQQAQSMAPLGPRTSDDASCDSRDAADDSMALDCQSSDSLNVNDLGLSQQGRQEEMPLVLLGDFNSLPNSGVLDYLLGGEINSLHKDFKNFKYTSCENAISSGFLSEAFNMNNDFCEHQNTAQFAALTDDSLMTLRLRQQQSRNHLGNFDSQPRRKSTPAWCFYSQQFAGAYEEADASGERPLINYRHSFHLNSAYEKDLMAYTNYTPNFKAIIDYILYSRHSIRLLGLLGPLDKNWLNGNRIEGLPQPHLPSDHLPLLVSFELIDRRRPRAIPASPPATYLDSTNSPQLPEPVRKVTSLTLSSGHTKPKVMDYSRICQKQKMVGKQAQMNLHKRLINNSIDRV